MAEKTDTREMARELGRRVRIARWASGLTQEALAKEAKISRDALVRLERGKGESRPSTVSKVAGALGLDYHDLLPAPRRAAVPGAASLVRDEERDEFDELLGLAKRRARAEDISENEALGLIYREHEMISRRRRSRRRWLGLPRGSRPVMSRANAAAEAVSAGRGE
jgi:transcriptional regulator with XRE-family HTH domain